MALRQELPTLTNRHFLLQWELPDELSPERVLHSIEKVGRSQCKLASGSIPFKDCVEALASAKGYFILLER